MIGDDTPLVLSDLRQQKHFLDDLRFDVTPEVIFKSRFLTPENKEEAYGETHGFMFYVDCLEGEKPSLMLMKTKELRSSTVGFVEGVPGDLLEAAVSREGVKNYSGMYPLDEALINWLNEKLGV